MQTFKPWEFSDALLEILRQRHVARCFCAAAGLQRLKFWKHLLVLTRLTPIGTLELQLPGWTCNKNRIWPLGKWQSSSNQPPSYIFLSQLLSVGCATGGHGLMPTIEETLDVRWRANQGTTMRRIFGSENCIATPDRKRWGWLSGETFIVKVKVKVKVQSVSDVFRSIADRGSTITETGPQVYGAEYVWHLFLQREAAGNMGCDLGCAGVSWLFYGYLREQFTPRRFWDLCTKGTSLYKKKTKNKLRQKKKFKRKSSMKSHAVFQTEEHLSNVGAAAQTVAEC